MPRIFIAAIPFEPIAQRGPVDKTHKSYAPPHRGAPRRGKALPCSDCSELERGGKPLEPASWQVRAAEHPAPAGWNLPPCLPALRLHLEAAQNPRARPVLAPG